MDSIHQIRNFAIIAHIDHGKSTLADRFLELTGNVEVGKHEEQYLDRNPVSRERGITIKLAPVRMNYQLKNNNEKFVSKNATILNSQLLTLNLIDTPGHVDFSYEVDRTLASVEGVILLVDATQGIQAQTISNAYKALEKNLVIIPVINKIDLPNADIAGVKRQLMDFLGVAETDIFQVSAKTGQGVSQLLETIVGKIPSPSQLGSSSFQSLIFDSYYDSHRGVIAFVRVFHGQVSRKVKVKLFVNQLEFEASEVGIFTPDLKQKDALTAGEIGYIVTNLKDIHQVQVGDTIQAASLSLPPLAGYKRVKPMVFASMFPTDTVDYLNLKKALEKLYLNDSALEFSPIYSKAFGAGFRVGFLGLLHADVVRERLEREYTLNLVLTPPKVEYKQENGSYSEPIVKLFIITPNKYLGAVIDLCEKYRAKFITMDNKNQISLSYEMPMSEMISDFFDKLKSVTSGYASLDWEFIRYQPVKADKLAVLLNHQEVEEFSEVVVHERAFEKAFDLVKKIRRVIPRQQYEVKIQAQYKGKIIASERIAPFRKDVLIKSGKVIGTGDVGRKKKLLEKQKEGKKRMKMIGHVEIPKDAFRKLFHQS